MANPSGSLTMTMALDEYASFYEPSRLVTMTVTVRAKWWRRPFLWLCRKPTSREQVYTDVQLGSLEIHPDGSLTAAFAGAPSDAVPTVM